MLALALGLVLAMLAGCGPRPAARRADPTSDSYLQALARLSALEAAIAQEDAPRPEQPKARSVREQLAPALDAALAARAAARRDATRAATLPPAVAALEQRYLGSELDSTYAPEQPGPWSPDATRDVFGSPTAAPRMRAWQPPDAPTAFIKFAIPPPAPGQPLELRIGHFRTRHVDIAGGPALVAGVLRVRFGPDGPRVLALENASSGLRPGRLRLRLAVDLLRAHGWATPDLVVHVSPTGDYDRSHLAPLRRD
ncbi:MAG: hypothetical protein IT370_05215 [Deltaproteobacteria bacterium]|nr:hypothetical protein [Deltaproteobacteria bacterium]